MTRRQEKEQVRRILQGERSAGNWLVETYYPDLFRFLRYLTESEEAAGDLTQQTMISAWKALGGFRAGASLRTWLHRIAFHEYTRWRKAKPASLSLEEAGEIAGGSGLPLPEMLSLELALKRLPDEQREVFLLHHLQELSIADIAEVQGVAEGTIKSRLFVARGRLRALMSDETISPRQNGSPAKAIAGAEGAQR